MIFAQTSLVHTHKDDNFISSYLIIGGDPTQTHSLATVRIVQGTKVSMCVS